MFDEEFRTGTASMHTGISYGTLWNAVNEKQRNNGLKTRLSSESKLAIVNATATIQGSNLLYEAKWTWTKPVCPSDRQSDKRVTTVSVICAINEIDNNDLPEKDNVRCPYERSPTTAPPQSVGYCSQNGCSDASLFLKWMENFVQITNPSVDMLQVIVLGGYHSHETLAAVEYA